MHGKQNGDHEIACINRRNLDEAGVRNYCCDLLDKDAVNAVIEDFKPDRAFLVAWETTHGSYWHDQSNVKWADASINFAEKFAEQGGKFLTFAGTCAEYQWSSEMMVEGSTPEIPHTLYGREKLRVTNHLLGMRAQDKLDANSCRLFFPYSERENENRVTSLIVKSILEDKPMHLRTGDVYRDICHTRDLAEAMCAMNFAGAGGLYNMSADKPRHLGEFLKQIAEQMGKGHLVTWDNWNDEDMSGGEPRHLYGSNEKIRPYLTVPNSVSDIQTFVQASVERFSRSDR